MDQKKKTDDFQVDSTSQSSKKNKETPFDIRVFYKDNELKSLVVEQSNAGAGQTSLDPTKHTVAGTAELCDFMIEHFSAIKKTLNLAEGDATSSTKATPTQKKSVDSESTAKENDISVDLSDTLSINASLTLESDHSELLAIKAHVEQLFGNNAKLVEIESEEDWDSD